ncbi:hypothetical protein HDU87_004205 [Geranomyces variabilis]|uniref:Uncharacterized protein n=1 Tax=Geranomyces variabilis TaxID=109894 RepID=A0AAD5TKK2_9FUNG|nr:hypothetical protein HDU87_004205 [Geranomyces variabilis]
MPVLAFALLRLLRLLLLLLGLLAYAQARFAPGVAYTYQVRSLANTHADFEKTILSAGGAPANTLTRTASSYIFNADVEIAAYNVTADGLTLCKVSFLSTPEFILGSAATDQGDGAPRHDGSGALDFYANWFGFAVRPNGVVDHIIYSADESPSVLAMKRGLVSHFSAPINTPTGGPKKRSFSEDEPSQFGIQVNSYDVEADNETITYKKCASLGRRADDDQSRVDHVGEKTLVKHAKDGHLLSISVKDRAILKGSFSTEREGLWRRDSDSDTNPEQDALMSAWGLSDTALISKGAALHIDAPPADLTTGPVFAVPPPHVRPLNFVMPIVRQNLKCFDGSVVASQTIQTTGEKAGCFANARQALSLLSPEDALIASDYLMSVQNMGSRLWLGFDLVGEMCNSAPELLERMLRNAFETNYENNDDILGGAALGLQAAFKCTKPTRQGLDILKSVVSRHAMPGSDIEIDHAALLFGFLGLQLQNLGKSDEAAAITAILTTALNHPARKLARRSPESRDFGEAPEDEHFQEESIQASHTAARRATLVLAIGHTRDASTVSTLRATIFDAEAGYHPVVREAALDALGKLSGPEVENTLLTVLTSDEHLDVVPSALNALRARDRAVDIEQVALGAEELQRMYTFDSVRSGPLSERALRARDVTEMKVDLVLAAPSFIFDKKLGADLVGVRLVANAINQVKLFLSILMSDFAITINNLATAALYIDLGGYQEIEIFRAELQFIGEISYNTNVLHGFKLSDVANFKQIFSGWIDQIEQEFTTVQTEVQDMWNEAKLTFTSLEDAITTLSNPDWSDLLNSLLNFDDEIAIILDIFNNLQDNVVAFAFGIKNDVLNAIDAARGLMDDAISLILGGFTHILECPEKSVAAILQAVENVHQIALLLQNSFHDLESKCSRDSLENLLPAVDEEFGDYINDTLSAYPELQVITTIYLDFDSMKNNTEQIVNTAITTYSDFRVKLTELVTLYNKLKSYYDATFGPKADSAFPSVPSSVFPSETLSVNGQSYQGMSVQADPGTIIVAPFAGDVSVIDRTTLKIEVTESSLKSYVIYLSNVITSSTVEGPAKKGDPMAQVSGPTIGLFIYGGRLTKESVDPRKYLSRSLPIKNPFIVSANMYGMRVMGYDVVPVQAIIKASTKDDTQKGGTEELSGDSGLAARGLPIDNVCDDPRFANLPQVCFNATIPESPRAMQLYKIEELMFLAGIPITFSLTFNAVMGISAALSLCLTDLTVTPTLTPHFAIKISGFAGAGVPGLNVGVTADGTVADTRLPITPQFPLAEIPTGVCLSIDVIIIPLSIQLGLSITVILFTYKTTIVTFTMDPITLHILQTCPSGPVKKDQVGYLVDSTGPIISSSSAYQLPNESADTPFVLARFASHDDESGMTSVTVGLGWSPADMQIVPPRVIPRDQGDSWTIPISPDPLLDEKTVFVNVIHMNMQNLTTTTSTPIFIDFSAPVVTMWNEQTPIKYYNFAPGTQNPRAVLRKNLADFSEILAYSVNGSSYTAFQDHLCFYYSVTDGTTQNTTSWAIGTGKTGPEASNVVAWTVDPTSGQGVTTVCQSVALQHAQLYYLNLATQNALGYSTTQTSPPTLTDFTPPLPGSIFFGTQTGVTMNGTLITSTAYFNFIDYTDPESGIACNRLLEIEKATSAFTDVASLDWNFAIGLSPSNLTAVEHNVDSWTPFKPWTPYYINSGYTSYVSLFINGLNMTEGNHTMCVSATNFVGLSTTTCTKGYIVDLTPPTGAASLTVGSNLDLTVSFTYADDLSGVQTVLVGLGDTLQPHFADYVTLNVGDSPQNEIAFPIDLGMQGQIVYGLLIIVDYASNSRHVYSDQPVLIDVVPPNAGTVGDGWTIGGDITWTNVTNVFCASWTEWSSNVTAVGRYELCFGTQAGACDIVPLQDVALLQRSCLNATALVDDATTVYATVNGWNGAGAASSMASSDGVTVDLTPPDNFTVSIITQTGSPFVRDIEELSASWTPSFDLESGVDKYLVALRKISGNTASTLNDFVVPDLSNPLNTQATIRGRTYLLRDNDQVEVCVQAYNVAGMSTTFCSDPVTLDTGHPTLNYRRYLDQTAPLTPFYVTNINSVYFAWNWTAVSGISTYACTVSRYDTGEVVDVYSTADQLGCHISATSSILIDGQTYQALGSATSNTGTSQQTAFNFIAATTPPQWLRGASGSVSYGHPNVPVTTDPTAARAWCEFSSAIPILSYQFAFGWAANATNLTNSWITTTNPFYAFSYLFNASSTPVYYALCRATNDAGQTSEQYLEPGTMIEEGAQPGAVYDGSIIGVETSVQTSTEVVVASFQGFTTAAGIPGIMYTWGLGTSPTTQDVVNFTSAGLMQPNNVRNGTIFWAGTKLSENVLYFVHVQALVAGNSPTSNAGLETVTAVSSGFRVFSHAPTTGYDAASVATVQYATGTGSLTLNCTAQAANGGLDKITQRATRFFDSTDLLNDETTFTPTSQKTVITTLNFQPENDGETIATSCEAAESAVGIFSAASRAFWIVDNSAPIGVSNLTCFPQWIAANGNAAFCDWEDAQDNESEIVSYTLAVGTTAGGAEIALYPELLGKNFTLGVTQVVPTGAPILFLTVTATNAVGLSTSAVTSVSVEWSPPTYGPGSVAILNQYTSLSLITQNNTTMQNNTVAVLQNADQQTTCQSVPSVIRVSWDGAFIPLSSPITFYEIAVSTADLRTYGEIDHVAQDWKAVGNVTSYRLGLTDILATNSYVFVSVRAWTLAGLSSVRSSDKVGVTGGYNIPASKPQALLVSQQLSTSSTTTTFAIKSNYWRASWQFVHVCSIAKYQWAVIDITNLDEPAIIYGPLWTGATSGLALNLDLSPNRTYTTRVQAFDDLGTGSTVNTSLHAVTIIWQPAAAGRVYDGPVALKQTDAFVSVDTIAASWESFSSQDCEVHGYQWAVGSGTSTTAEQNSVFPFTDVGDSTFSASFSLDTNLTMYEMYYTTVRATSCTGEILYGFSTGFHVGIFEPPVLGSVALLQSRPTASGVLAQASTTSVQISWIGFASVWSKLSFDVALGTSPNYTDVGSLVQNFMAVDVQAPADLVYPSHTLTNLTLTPSSGAPSFYYVFVRATDAGFQTSTAVSDPFLVDLSPPIIGRVTLQNEAMNDTTWQSSTQMITFSIDGVIDQESSISDISYKLLMGDQQNATLSNPDDWISLGNRSLTLTANSTGNILAYVDLLENVPYAIAVKVTNGASESTVTVSQQLAVDLEAPTVGSLVVGTDFSSNVRYSTSADNFDLLYAEAFNQSEVDCWSFDANFSQSPPGNSSIWTLPQSGCALNNTNTGLTMQLFTGNSSCEIQSTVFASGSKFTAQLQPSTVANSFTSFIVSDSTVPIGEQPVTNLTVVSNTTSPFNAIGFQISGGTPITVSIWRVDRHDKSLRAQALSVDDPSVLLGLLKYSITLRTSEILMEVTDPISGNLVVSRTLGTMETEYSWLEQLPRMSARIRLWAPGKILALPNATVGQVTHPLPNTAPCSYQSTWASLISGIFKTEISIGKESGVSDVLNYQHIVNLKAPEGQGCLGDSCFLSSPVNGSTNVALRQFSLQGLGLTPFDYVNDWCDLKPLEGGCSGAASCINQPFDIATGNNTFICNCGDGWTGTGLGLHGCSPVQQCEVAAAANITLCAPGAMCVDAPGTFLCMCPQGYVATDPYSRTSIGCVEQDECAIAKAAHLDLCGSGGVCQNIPGDYQCICRTGFVQVDAHTCADIDECEAMPCASPKQCVNEIGGYKSAPLTLGVPTAATLSSSHSLLDPQFGGQVGVWYLVDNPALTSIKISFENDSPGNMTLHLKSDCLSSAIRYECQSKRTVAAFAPIIVECVTSCANGGTCLGNNICQCHSEWTGPTCEIPAYDMMRPRAANFTCLDAALGGAIASRGACAPGPMPMISSAELVSYSFTGCYRLSTNLSLMDPAGLSLVIPTSRLSLNLTIQGCATLCKQSQLPLFTLMSAKTWHNHFSPELENATSQCLCPSCKCQDGYTKASDGTCVDQDECAVADPPCSVIATCINTVGSYYCFCNTTIGYFPTADNFTCRLTNKANLTATTWTHPITIDQDPPVFQNITFSYQGNDVDVLRNGSQEAAWQFQSNTSGMAYYRYGLGSAPGLTDIVPSTRTLSSNVTFTIPNPSSTDSNVYFVVTGYSGSMLNTTQSVEMTLMTGPPDINGAIVEYLGMGRFLQWQNFGEPVSSYYVGIGTQPGGNNLLNWTMISNSNITSGPFLTGLCTELGCGTPLLPKQLPSVATPVWFSIRADNRAGFWSPPVSVSFPTLLFGSDAALILPTGNLTTSSAHGFEDLSAVATITAQLPTEGTQSVAIIPIGPYQLSISQLTGITLSRPPPLLTIRAGATYAIYRSVHLHLTCVQEHGALSTTMPQIPINASISVQTLYSILIGAPTIYYQGQMNSTTFEPYSWIPQPTTMDSATRTLHWQPSAPGIYGLYYNSTFPSFVDLNADAVADVLFVEIQQSTAQMDFGWGILGSSLGGPNSSRRFTASLSPSHNSTVGFSPTFIRSEVLAAVGDFDADGALDYVVSASGYPLYANWSAVSYQIVFARSALTLALNPPAVGAFPHFHTRHVLVGFADIDGDTFLDSIWLQKSVLRLVSAVPLGGWSWELVSGILQYLNF